MRQISCPHCTKPITLSGHSAFVVGREKLKREDRNFKEEEYFEDTTKRYKRSKVERSRQLSYYWRNRERVLAREKVKRLKVKDLLKGQNSNLPK